MVSEVEPDMGRTQSVYVETKTGKKDVNEKVKGPVYVDGYKNKKNQAPSYTDRCLFKNNTSFKHTVNKYDCYNDLLGSDHRPVYLDTTISTVAHQYLDLRLMTDVTMKTRQMFALL